MVLNENGELAGRVGEDGHLCITHPWPGMIRGTWGDDDGKRFTEVYFSMFKGVYTTGDGCAIDADGDHWLKGRIDDVLNVSGHRIGTADVESALVSHPAVAEAAVVGYPHAIKGTGIYTYVTLIDGVEPSDALRKELAVHVRKVVGPIATPDKMQFAEHGSAQDALGQDHAPHPAQDRRGRVRRPWATPPPWPTRPWSKTSSWAPCRRKDQERQRVPRGRGGRKAAPSRSLGGHADLSCRLGATARRASRPRRVAAGAGVHYEQASRARGDRAARLREPTRHRSGGRFCPRARSGHRRTVPKWSADDTRT